MSARRVVAVVPDLFFAARIAEVAKTLGVELEACDAARAATACRERPTDLVVLDLTTDGPLAVMDELRSAPETRGIRVVAFYSHVEGERRSAALAAGVTEVLPRSVFTRRLPELLAGDAGGRR